MFKIAKADKDTYITDKVVKGKRKVNSNVGSAGTLDLFKLHNVSRVNNQPVDENSRILIHFDISGIKKLFSDGKLNINDSSFWCEIHMKDVYGGQTLPENFTVSVFPLSSSFDEGIGRDVSYYSDADVASWISSSANSQWFITGCNLKCSSSAPGDYITSSVSLASTEVSQTFKLGDEDLIVDVTKIVSATLTGELPDAGFRISFNNTAESDNKTYFVKRFASRSAYDVDKRPSLLMGYDDSITDDSQNLEFDTSCNLTLYNYSKGSLSNILSGSSLSPVVGQNCIILKLIASIPSGSYELPFSGSQVKLGNFVNGVYNSSVTVLSSDPILSPIISSSGSVKFTPVWTSVDGNVAYLTGSIVEFKKQTRGEFEKKNYVVTTSRMNESYPYNSEPIVRINIFDNTSPYIKLRKLPLETPSVVLPKVFYQIRDAVTNKEIIPFDYIKNSTKLSADSTGMFFRLMTSNLRPGSTYSVDIMIEHNGTKEVFKDVSPIFRVDLPENSEG